MAGPDKTACVQQAKILFTPALKRFGAEADGARGVYHVVDEEAVFILDFTDDIHDLDLIGFGTTLVDDRHGAIEFRGDRSRPSDASDVGRDDDETVVNVFFEISR